MGYISVEINRSNLTNISEIIWEQFFNLRVLCDESPGGKLPITNYLQLKERITTLFEKDDKLLSIILFGREGEHFFEGYLQIAGGISLPRQTHMSISYHSFKYQFNKELIDLIRVYLEKYYDSKRDTQIVLSTHNRRYEKIAEKMGGEIVEYTNNLYLEPKDLNHDIVDEWCQKYGDLNSEELELRFYHQIPEELLEQYCQFFTQLTIDMSKPHLFVNEVSSDHFREGYKNEESSGLTTYTYLAMRRGSDEIVGMTNIRINKNDPSTPYQFMTGVKSEYRNRGVAKWLKGNNIRRLLNDFSNIDYIVTEITPNNFGSLTLAKLMGYRFRGSKLLYRLKI